MRVVSSLLMLAVLCGSEAMAQDVRWGVKGGLNLATLSSDEDPEPEFKYRGGLIAGGFLTWPLGERVDLQPEVLFSQQGASFDADGVDDIKLELNSLVVPVLVRYKFTPSGPGLVLFAGPSIGFKLSADVTVDTDGEDVTDDVSDNIKDVDYGLVFGAGWDTGRFSIDGRYTLGLTSLGTDEDDPNNVRSRVFAVLAGVRF
jgi:hypothetical protein